MWQSGAGLAKLRIPKRNLFDIPDKTCEELMYQRHVQKKLSQSKTPQVIASWGRNENFHLMTGAARKRKLPITHIYIKGSIRSCIRNKLRRF